MKHIGFLKSLKALKSHILKNKKTIAIYPAATFPEKETNLCTCTDAQGETKYLYNSEKELSYLLSKKDIKLQAYPCPHEKGWHLSKV